MMEKNGHKVKLFALSSNKGLAEEIAKSLGTELSSCDVKRFADGEISINIYETVRGRDVFIIQSTCNPVNEHYMELLIMIDACKRASARTINIVMPYYGYSRQDRKARSRQPITAKLMANLLEKAGADRVLSLDLHASQIQGFFDIPIDNFKAMPIIAKYLMTKDLKDVTVVSPDHGGTNRARSLAKILDAPLAIIDKRRPKPNVSEVMNIIGDVEGQTCIIIDDMIDTAGTICIAAQALLEKGAKRVFAACTHPIFSGPAIERLEKSVIEEVITTNTIELAKEKQIAKITQLSIGDVLASCIVNIIEDKALSTLFEYKEQ